VHGSSLAHGARPSTARSIGHPAFLRHCCRAGRASRSGRVFAYDLFASFCGVHTLRPELVQRTL
jgi:hypothetical protein